MVFESCIMRVSKVLDVLLFKAIINPDDDCLYLRFSADLE